MAGRQGAGGALAVHAQQPTFAVDLVVLELGQVVGHVVEEIEVGDTEHGRERPSGSDREELAVGPPVVRRRGHRPEVAATLPRGDRRARELRIGDRDARSRAWPLA